MDRTELYHYGIKGMRWGTRRYRNKDGTLTTEGKARYDETDSLLKTAKEETAKEIEDNDSEIISDDELRDIAREKLNSEFARRNHITDLRELRFRYGLLLQEREKKLKVQKNLAKRSEKLNSTTLDKSNVGRVRNTLRKNGYTEYLPDVTDEAKDEIAYRKKLAAARAKKKAQNSKKGTKTVKSSKVTSLQHSTIIFKETSMTQNELYHHGILGQRWGVRRFQNPDGTYTSVGKQRRRMSDDAYEYSRLKKKSKKEMSNKELIKYNTRANLEYQYDQNTPSVVKKGENKIKRVLEIAGTIYTAKKMITKFGGLNAAKLKDAGAMAMYGLDLGVKMAKVVIHK